MAAGCGESGKPLFSRGGQQPGFCGRDGDPGLCADGDGKAGWCLEDSRHLQAASARLLMLGMQRRPGVAALGNRRCAAGVGQRRICLGP